MVTLSPRSIHPSPIPRSLAWHHAGDLVTTLVERHGWANSAVVYRCGAFCIIPASNPASRFFARPGRGSVEGMYIAELPDSEPSASTVTHASSIRSRFATEDITDMAPNATIFQSRPPYCGRRPHYYEHHTLTLAVIRPKPTSG